MLEISRLIELVALFKSAFKRAIGHLLKTGLIEEDKTAGTITLIKDPEENDNGED